MKRIIQIELFVQGVKYFKCPLDKQHYREAAVLKTPEKGDWYIYYSIWNFSEGRWEIQKYYSSYLNNRTALALSPSKRLQTAKIVEEEVNDTLKLNINPKTGLAIAPFDERSYLQAIEDATSNSPIPLLATAVEKFLTLKSGKVGKKDKVVAENKENTSSSYTSIFKRFLNYCEGLEIDKVRMDRITKFHVYDFLESIYEQGVWSETTYNIYLRIFKGFFKHFAKIYDYQNYIENIASKEESGESDRFAPFSDAQVVEIFQYLDSSHEVQYNTHIRTVPPDKFMSTICRTVLYSFIRPSEISRLKIKHVKRYKEGYFDLSIDITKNKKKSTNEVYIEPNLIAIYQTLGWEQYFADKRYENYYVFTENLVPGPKRASSYYFRQKFTLLLRKFTYETVMENGEMIKKIRNEWDDSFSLYSFKHSGNIQAYKAGYSLFQLQLQNRHGSVQQTENYLRRLKQEINAGERPSRPSY